jgi:hypothetical protein
MAYDAARERVVLFGGRSMCVNAMALDDTWEWDGRRWEHRDARNRPQPRWFHAMAFDWVRGRVLLFGGSDGTTVYTDTWEWDGRDWRQVPTTAAPGIRVGHRMASDPLRGRIVLFGGYTGLAANDTWEWDGQTWQRMWPRTIPEARGEHGMAFNALTGRIAMTGGRADQALNNPDTVIVWEWDGVDWTRLHGGVSPGKWYPLSCQRTPSQRQVSFVNDVPPYATIELVGVERTDLPLRVVAFDPRERSTTASSRGSSAARSGRSRR